MSAPVPSPLAAPRRRTRTRAIGALALVAAAPLVLGACSSAVGEQSAATDTATPVAGGTLRVGTSMDLQPSIFLAAIFGSFNGNVLEALVDYPAEGLEPQPRLATAWEVSPDGRTVTLDLQEDVTFHSGRAFTSKDVAFSIKTVADPANAAPIARSAAVITGFDTSAPDRITLTLEHPMSNLFDVLAAVPILDSESVEGIKDGSAVVGTGPFTFESWTPGSGYVFARNESYWGEEALLDKVEFKVVPDPQALTSQLRAGQLDVVQGIGARDVEALGEDERYVVTTAEGGGGGTYLGVNVTQPGLDDVKVRQALAHAIDQDRIVEEVFLGHARGGDLPWTSDSPIYDESLDDHYEYDLDKAADLLTQAGATDLSFPLSYAAESPQYAAIAQILQADLKQIGVEVELTPRPTAEIIQLGAVPGGIEGLWLNGHQWTSFSPATIPVSAYAFNSEQNISKYDNAAYKAAARSAWATTPEKALGSEVYPELATAFLAGAFVNEVVVTDASRVTTTAVHDLGTGKTVGLGLATAYLADQ